MQQLLLGQIFACLRTTGNTFEDFEDNLLSRMNHMEMILRDIENC
jgi:hypothetical protein